MHLVNLFQEMMHLKPSEWLLMEALDKHYMKKMQQDLNKI